MTALCKQAQASRMNVLFVGKVEDRRTRTRFQLRANPISVMGYGCRTMRQYSRSSSASDIGSVPGWFLYPARWPPVSSGSRTHSCVKFAKSASYTRAVINCEYAGGQLSRRAYRTAERAELPVENPDHAVLRRVEDQVVQLVVAMHDPHARLALVG